MSYPVEYWQDRIQRYGKEEWSHSLSPFGADFAGHLEPHSTILELGTGAGQDALGLAALGFSVIATDGVDAQFAEIKQRGSETQNHPVRLQTLQLLDPFEFEDNSFDAVYAQLVLHYFTDEQMRLIVAEIRRVLKPGGYFGVLTNTIDDPEFVELPLYLDHADMRIDREVIKRYFSVESLGEFMDGFEVVAFDNQGRTPKDDVSGVGTLIRFIGRNT